MRRRLRLLAFVILPLTFVAAVCLVLAINLASWLSSFNDSVTLPNGMILARQFDGSSLGRDDLLAADGTTVLVEGVEFVCFDDRYVSVVALQRGSGLFDAALGGAVPGATVFSRERGLYTRNGYYTLMLGPGHLYGGSPFQPSCQDRNLDRNTLADRSWFERPCSNP